MVLNLASSDFIRNGGGVWSNTSNATRVFTVNTVDAVGQAALANFAAPSGHYNVGFHFVKQTDGAIIDIALDGEVIATYDLYAAVPANFAPVINDLIISDGDHYMTATVTGKNGASTGHTCYLGFVSITSR